MIDENSTFKYAFSFTQQAVNEFARVTGDDNPIHLDERYAAETIFKRPIMHGFLGGSVFSKIFGTLFPGNGTIYLEQTMTFLKPMFAGETFTASIAVLSIDRQKHRARVKTDIINASNETFLTGEALIMHKELL